MTLFGIALYNYLKYREATSVREGSSPIADKHVEFSPLAGSDEPEARLGMYNMANESTAFGAHPEGGGYRVQDETTILGEDSEEEEDGSEDDNGLKKLNHEQVDKRDLHLERLEEDDKLKALDREELLFDAELDRKL